MSSRYLERFPKGLLKTFKMPTNRATAPQTLSVHRPTGAARRPETAFCWMSHPRSTMNCAEAAPITMGPTTKARPKLLIICHRTTSVQLCIIFNLSEIYQGCRPFRPSGFPFPFSVIWEFTRAECLSRNLMQKFLQQNIHWHDGTGRTSTTPPKFFVPTRRR